MGDVINSFTINFFRGAVKNLDHQLFVFSAVYCTVNVQRHLIENLIGQLSQLFCIFASVQRLQRFQTCFEPDAFFTFGELAQIDRNVILHRNIQRTY